METFIEGAAGMAALAIVFVIFFNDLLGGTLSSGASTLLVLATLVFVTALNLASVRVNKSFATVVTGLKVALLIGIAGCAFFFGDGSWANYALSGADGTCEGVPADARMGLAGFGAAIIAAMWSYSGAITIIVIAEEVRDPSRTLPRALFSSALTLIGLYVLVNAAYFYALSPDTVASIPESSSVAGTVIARVVGAGASTLMAAGLMLSSFGALHCTVLEMARFPFAMARDRLLPALFATVSRNAHVPTHAVLLLGACSIAFAISGTACDATPLSHVGLSLPACGVSAGNGLAYAQHVVRHAWAVAGRFGSDRARAAGLCVLRARAATVANGRLAR
jgi:APA family basic amino acid/polyamine antiporter